METSALGRAEWMRFYGLLFGVVSKADSLFAEVDSCCLLYTSAQKVGGDTITGKVHQIEKVTVTARRLPNKVASAVPLSLIHI